MPEPEKVINNNAEQVDQPTREVTQTDHINKKLLASLFKRMDDGEDPVLNKMLEPENNSENNDDWTD